MRDTAAVAPVLLICAVLLFKTNKLLNILSIALLTLLIFYGASILKKIFIGHPLFALDLRFLNLELWILAVNDWRVLSAVAVTIAIIGILTFLYFKLPFLPRSRRRLAVFATLVIVAAAMGVATTGKTRSIFGVSGSLPSVKVFMATIWLFGDFDLYPDPIPNELASIAPGGPKQAKAAEKTLPHIVFILQESTISPAQLVSAGDYRSKNLFVDHQSSKTGKLRVNVFGGNTWLSEFALVMQFRPEQFGARRRYVFFITPGHVRRSLFHVLKDKGYESAVVVPIPRSFVNTGAFYESLGVDRFEDPAAAGIGTGWDWHLPDRTFLRYAVKQLGRPKPQVLFVHTINQHGPHKIDDPMGDYLARYGESDRAYGEFVKQAKKLTTRPIVFVTFGDHQPTMMSGLSSPPPRYETSYQVECTEMSVCDFSSLPEQIDLTLLATYVFQMLGFEKDNLMIAQTELAAHCPGDISACNPSILARYNWHVSQMVFKGGSD